MWLILSQIAAFTAGTLHTVETCRAGRVPNVSLLQGLKVSMFGVEDKVFAELWLY